MARQERRRAEERIDAQTGKLVTRPFRMNPAPLGCRQFEWRSAPGREEGRDVHDWPHGERELPEELRLVSPYEQAFKRVRAEYQDMPGMRLTARQVQRLSGVEKSVCKRVLDDLVRAKFLYIEHDGAYARCMGLWHSRERAKTGEPT
jgi:hypothetical protein